MSTDSFKEEWDKKYYDELCEALKEGAWQRAKDLSPKVVNINQASFDEDNPLHLAIKKCAGYEVLKTLLEKGIDVSKEDEGGELPLMLAIEKKNIEAVELILDYGADVYVVDGDGSTPLHRAVALGLDRVVNLLLKQGLFVDIGDRYNNTPLHLAAKQGYEAIVKLLLANGADLDEVDRHNRTALHHASMGGYYGTVCSLIDYGGNVNRRDYSQRTSLHDAAWLGHIDVVRILLNCYADINCRDCDGFTALHHAAMRGHEDVIVELLDRGADLSRQDKWGRTVLHHVILRGNYDMIKMLIEYSDDLNTPDFNNLTPLNCILSGMPSTTAFQLNRHIELTELLVKHAVRIAATKNHSIQLDDFIGLKQHLSDERWNDVCVYSNKCLEEIEKIKQFHASEDSISIYDFLTENSSTLAKYVRNDDATIILDTYEWETEFPIYSSFIKARAHKATEKRDLMLLAVRSLRVIAHPFLSGSTELPDIPSYKILKDMTILDLKNLIKACIKDPV